MYDVSNCLLIQGIFVRQQISLGLNLHQRKNASVEFHDAAIVGAHLLEPVLLQTVHYYCIDLGHFHRIIAPVIREGVERIDGSDDLILEVFNSFKTVEVVLLKSQQFCECFQLTTAMFCISQRDGMGCGILEIHFGAGTLVEDQERQACWREEEQNGSTVVLKNPRGVCERGASMSRMQKPKISRNTIAIYRATSVLADS